MRYSDTIIEFSDKKTNISWSYVEHFNNVDTALIRGTIVTMHIARLLVLPCVALNIHSKNDPNNEIPSIFGFLRFIFLYAFGREIRISDTKGFSENLALILFVKTCLHHSPLELLPLWYVVEFACWKYISKTSSYKAF